MEWANREIGSEFWNVEVCKNKNKFFSNNVSWYLSGRSALKAIIADIKQQKNVFSVAMPSWCCDSMITPFLEEGIEVCFYPVQIKDGALIQQIDIADNCDILYLMDYFGYVQDFSFEFSGIIIRDITHSVFSKKYNDADYYFGSLRKWSGFFTGGFAIGLGENNETHDCNIYLSLRQTAMQEKSEYICGKSQSKNYLSIFEKAEKLLDTCQADKAALCDIERAKFFDVDFIKKRRRENAELLLKEFSNIAIFSEVKSHDCPMFVPVLLDNSRRNSLRAYLIEKKIYCPIHWPISKYHSLNSDTSDIYERELSLICDQRYDANDMIRMIDVIKKF